MRNLMKTSLTGIATVVAALGFAGAASANSIVVEINGGTGPLNVDTSATSTTFTVTVFALLGATGGGSQDVNASLSYNSSVVTATACAEAAFPNLVGADYWGPGTTNCGKGNPADGGLLGPAGIVEIIDQTKIVGLGASGKLKLGTVTFHHVGAGNTTIQAFFAAGVGGFLGNDFVNRTTGALGSVTVNHIPEPATVALLGLGILGLSLSGRRMRRR